MQQVPGASAALNLGYICISNFPSIYVTDQFEKAQLVTKHIKIRKSRISFIPWIRQQCSSSLDTMTSRLRHRRCKAANQSLAMLLLQQKQYSADKLCNVAYDVRTDIQRVQPTPSPFPALRPWTLTFWTQCHTRTRCLKGIHHTYKICWP